MSSFNVIFCLLLLLNNFNNSDCTLRLISSIISRRYPDGLGIKRTMSDLNRAYDGEILTTSLDKYRNLFVLARRMNHRLTDPRLDEILENQRQLGKLQDFIPNTVRFPCDVSQARSAQPPTSVHRVRPGDIDVIASMGDSLSAGNGIYSMSITHILNEYRGVSFSGGGLGTWREFLTLPNILKVFNPQLTGFATANELTVDESSHLNIAEPMLMSRDLPYQVKTFIMRMNNDPKIDMAKHWKLLTIFVGNNDICSDMCHHKDKEEFLKRHEYDMRKALTMLRDNVPRLIVNILSVPQVVSSLYAMRNPPFICKLVHMAGCHCVFSERIKGEKLRAAANVIDRWQAIDEYVASLEEFQTDDFSAIVQPFTMNFTLPSLPNGDTDQRFFSADCFHFSQLGHASGANLLWNNMMQPLNNKEQIGKMMKPFSKFLCPTDERPYIATWKNSLEGFQN